MTASPAQIRAHQSFLENGRHTSKAAKAINVTVAAFKKTLLDAHLNGLTVPTEYCKHLPAGMDLNKASVLVGSDGETKLTWYKGNALKQNQEEVFAYLKKRVPVGKIKTRKPKKVDEDVQLEWTLADLHYGMLAFGKESGENYDIKIARELLLDSASDIFARAGRVKETCLVLMGDNFHADFKNNRTEKSHHSLDVDGRYSKIVYTGVETFASAIEICLQFSETVRVIVLYGNHDGQTSVCLELLLYYYFRGLTDRVKVVIDPAKANYNFWGAVATIYHHGDGTQPVRVCTELTEHLFNNDMVGYRWKYAKQAHLHKHEIKNIGGVTYEYVPSPVARDQYAAGACFGNDRATVATKYHKKYGDIGRYAIPVQCLNMRKEEIAT